MITDFFSSIPFLLYMYAYGDTWMITALYMGNKSVTALIASKPGIRTHNLSLPLSISFHLRYILKIPHDWIMECYTYHDVAPQGQQRPSRPLSTLASGLLFRWPPHRKANLLFAAWSRWLLGFVGPQHLGQFPARLLAHGFQCTVVFKCPHWIIPHAFSLCLSLFRINGEMYHLYTHYVHMHRNHRHMCACTNTTRMMHAHTHA